MDTIIVTRAIVVVAALVVLAAGCGGDTTSAASEATSFPSGACASILRWKDDLAGAANAFTDDSPSLTETQRRARYLFAFDEQTRATDHLRDDLNSLPTTGIEDADAVRAVLLKAVDDVHANIADQKADAAAHVDFGFIGPRPDRLFAGTEKSESLMLKPLDELARDRNIAELGGSCGRR